MAPAITDPATRFWRKVDRSAGLFACWPWTGCFNRPSATFQAKHQAGVSRRPTFRLSRTPSVMVYAHRYALSLADGVALVDRAGLEACHTCGNPACCNPAHLYWGTPDQNREDRYGKHPRPAPAYQQDGL